MIENAEQSHVTISLVLDGATRDLLRGLHALGAGECVTFEDYLGDVLAQHAVYNEAMAYLPPRTARMIDALLPDEIMCPHTARGEVAGRAVEALLAGEIAAMRERLGCPAHPGEGGDRPPARPSA